MKGTSRPVRRIDEKGRALPTLHALAGRRRRRSSPRAGAETRCDDPRNAITLQWPPTPPRFEPETCRNAPAKRGSLRWVRDVLIRVARGWSRRAEQAGVFARASPDTPLSLVMRQRAELGARLLVHDPATQVVRHLFIVHDELRGGGWTAVEALPAAVVGRAVAEAEILATHEPSPLLATIIDALREIKAAGDASAVRKAHEALEAEWEMPKMPEVSDTNFDEYELMERSWAGTVPSGLRDAVARHALTRLRRGPPDEPSSRPASGSATAPRRSGAPSIAGHATLPGDSAMFRMPRLLVLPLACLAAFGAGLAHAADYPTKPVKWVVPYTPAGTTDVLARIVAQWLTEQMGQPFIVENKPGRRQQPRHRVRRQRAARRLHDAAGEPGQRHQRDALQEPQLQLHPRHRAGRRHRAHAQRDGGDADAAGEDGGRVHRLLQGQPGQDQHGVVGQRHLGAPVGRALQVDDRLQHAARAVQGRGPGADRPDGRPGRR